MCQGEQSFIIDLNYRRQLGIYPLDRAERKFKRLLADAGFSEKVAKELWKWYDSSEKKGVASF
jgi:hypothetical protein